MTVRDVVMTYNVWQVWQQQPFSIQALPRGGREKELCLLSRHFRQVHPILGEHGHLAVAVRVQDTDSVTVAVTSECHAEAHPLPACQLDRREYLAVHQVVPVECVGLSTRVDYNKNTSENQARLLPADQKQTLEICTPVLKIPCVETDDTRQQSTKSFG